MIFFKSDLQRAQLLAQIETERRIFQQMNAPKIKHAQKIVSAFRWIKTHPFFVSTAILGMVILLPHPKLKKIKTAWWIYQKTKKLVNVADWLEKKQTQKF